MGNNYTKKGPHIVWTLPSLEFLLHGCNGKLCCMLHDGI